MKRKSLIGFFLLSLSWNMTASPVLVTDSLKQMADTAVGKQKVTLYIQLSEQYRNISVYDCKGYFQKAFALASQLKDENLMGLAQKTMGVSYFYWGDMPHAFQFFKNGLNHYRKAGNLKGESNCLNNMGLVYEGQARFDSAAYYYKASYLMEKKLGNLNGEALSLINMGNIEYYRKNYHDALKFYFKALQNFVKTEDQNGIAMAYNSIAIIYTQIGEYRKALSYLQKAQNIYIITGDTRKLSRVLDNMADIYSDHTKEYKKAEMLYRQVLQMKKELNDKDGIALVKCNLGVLYSHMGLDTHALSFFDESQQLYEEIGDKTGLSMVALNKGRALLDAKSFNKAIIEFKKCLDISEKTGLKEYINNCYEGLFKCYAALGQYDQFNKYYSLFEQNRDTLTQKLEESRIAELEAHFKIDSLIKQRKKLLQESKRKETRIRTYILISISLFFLLIIVTLAFILFRKAKKEASKYPVNKI